MKSNYVLPEGILKENKFFRISSKRILIIADLHIPYYCKSGLELALEYGKKKKLDCVVILGDFLDFYQISRFNRSPDKPNISTEIKLGTDVLRYIRGKFPDAEIIFVEGNHEERLNKYVNEHSELFGLEEIKLKNLLKLRELNIKYIDEKRLLKAGKLILAHGHEINLGYGSVNPSRTVLLKTFSNVIFGHVHKTSEYITTKLDGSILGCWSLGHMSDPNPLYMPVNQWNFGFGFVEVLNGTGDFKVHNLKIYDGKIY